MHVRVEDGVFVVRDLVHVNQVSCTCIWISYARGKDCDQHTSSHAETLFFISTCSKMAHSHFQDASFPGNALWWFLNAHRQRSSAWMRPDGIAFGAHRGSSFSVRPEQHETARDCDESEPCLAVVCIMMRISAQVRVCCVVWCVCVCVLCMCMYVCVCVYRV